MAQMPIQSISGRAAPYAAPPPPVRPLLSTGKPAAAAPQGAQPIDPGAISGGLLRPGSIDQMTFRQRLEAAHRGGPVPQRPTGQSPLMVPPAAKSVASIPTLSPAQLAALGIDIRGLDLPGLDAATAPQAGMPAEPDLTMLQPGTADLPAPDAANPAIQSAPEPEAELASAPPMELGPNLPAPIANHVADPDAPVAPVPGARLGADGVWELTRLPDKDEREWFQGMNAKWRVVENPESVALFLGEDGKFGFDDFLDLINPLQHIPFVNMAYRALTGDEINGAAQMVSAVAMGPISATSTVLDLAFKSETGQGLAANGIAMLFGSGDETPQDVADYATAAGGTQMADASLIRRGSNR